jgi:hypothetical protein
MPPDSLNPPTERSVCNFSTTDKAEAGADNVDGILPQVDRAKHPTGVLALLLIGAATSQLDGGSSVSFGLYTRRRVAAASGRSPSSGAEKSCSS